MITRPAHQAGAITKKLKSAGANSFLFPTLEITAVELSTKDKQTLQKINQFNIIIFISPNAVEYGLNFILANATLANNIQLATIGQASATALKNKLGKQPDIVPTNNFNSEGLLATTEMKNVANKRILIIRGNGGREHLKESLQKRGAHVEYLTSYQRIKPATNTLDLTQYLQNNQIAAIVITSAASLKNLVEMAPAIVAEKLLHVPLVLINNRLKTIAKDAGFNNELFIAKQATDDSIIEKLKEHKLF